MHIAKLRRWLDVVGVPGEAVSPLHKGEIIRADAPSIVMIVEYIEMLPAVRSRFTAVGHGGGS